MPGLIDTHAHLSELGDMDGVIERAKKVGIEAIIGVGANLATCKRTLELADAFPGYVYPALGIHPTEWSEDDIASTTSFIEEHIDDCLAVGEIGLDYWNRNARRNKDIRERQRELYTYQLQMAREHEKSASVHGRGILGGCRRAGKKSRSRPHRIPLVQRSPRGLTRSPRHRVPDIRHASLGVQQASQGRSGGGSN